MSICLKEHTQSSFAQRPFQIAAVTISGDNIIQNNNVYSNTNSTKKKLKRTQ